MQRSAHPFRMVITFVVLALIGIAFIPKLNVNFTPSNTQPSVTITYGLANSSPDIVERMATSPLENALSQLEGINRIYSISRFNSGIITLDFDKGEDMDFKRFEINTILRNIYKKLPENMTYPRVEQRGGEEDESASPVLIYSVNGPFAPFRLQKEIDETIKKPLSSINEIKEITIDGATPLQITIDFDPDMTERYGLSRSQIASALTEGGGVTYPGMISTASGQQFFLKTTSSTLDITSLEASLIAVVDGNPIYLKDIARVYLEEQKPKAYRRINGENAVYLSIYAREGVNRIVLVDQVKAMMKNIALNQGMNVQLELDDTEFLREEMIKVRRRTALSISILVLFIFLINRNLKYLLTLFLGILVNLCITAIVLVFLKIELHVYSIAGLTISFGLIVDNAIVMLDHRHRKGNSTVFMALLAASLTTIMALLMVLLLPEEERRSLTDFSIVVAINLAVSLLVALFFTPALYDLLFKEKFRHSGALDFPRMRRKVRWWRRYGNSIHFLLRYRKAFILVVILGFGLPVFQLPQEWEGQDWYNKTIGSTKYQDDIRPVTDRVLGGALRKFVKEVYEGWGFRDPEQTKLRVNAKLPFGTTLEETNQVISRVEDFLKEANGVDKFVTNVRGRTALIEITFLPGYDGIEYTYQLKGRIEARVVDLAGVRWSITGVGRGFSVGGESSQRPTFRMKMKGYNYDELEIQAGIMADSLLANRRVQEVNTNEQVGWGNEQSSEYVLEFDIARLASAGLSRGSLTSSLKNFSEPSNSSLSANRDNERLPVFIKAANSTSFSRYKMMNNPIPADSGRFIRLNDFATLSFEQTANEIHKENRQYIRIIGFDYLGASRFGENHRDQIIEVMNETLPVGYSVENDGYDFGGGRAQRDYGLLGLLFLGIYFICAILFENLKQPLHIIVTIPISFIGLFLIFSELNYSFDQGGYAAFVLLGGLVVNASIFIVNDLNNRSTKNYNRAVLKAVTGKAMPILLTILSTCFGLIPFLLEGEDEVFWFALALGTIGGLLFSLVAVFVCLPVFLSRKLRKISA